MSVVYIPTQLQDAYEKHQRNCQVRELAVRQLENYQHSVGKFIQYAEDYGLPELEHLTQDHMEEYFLWFKNRTRWDGVRGKPQLISASTVDTQFRRLRAFFNYCVKTKTIALSENPMADMDEIKFDQQVIKVPEQEILDEVLKLTDYRNKVVAPTELSRFRRLRDRAAIFFLIDSPTRLSEINDLKVQDILVESNRGAYPNVSTKIWGKGGKERIVKLGRECSRVMVEYIDQRAEYVRRGEDALWVSAHGLKGTGMGRRWLWAMIMKLGWDVRTNNHPDGVRLTPHMFRHKFTIDWLLRGWPEYLLKEYAGWSDKIPKTYTKLINSEQAAAMVIEDSPVDALVDRRRRS